MQSYIYAIHDSKAGAYLQPFFMPNHHMAMRTFQDCVNDPKHNFGMHPEDYNLFEIGEFNDLTSELIYNTPIKSLGNGLDHQTIVSDQPTHEDYDRVITDLEKTQNNVTPIKPNGDDQP